jgi:hypothetical protein
VVSFAHPKLCATAPGASLKGGVGSDGKGERAPEGAGRSNKGGKEEPAPAWAPPLTLGDPPTFSRPLLVKSPQAPGLEPQLGFGHAVHRGGVVRRIGGV